MKAPSLLTDSPIDRWLEAVSRANSSLEKLLLLDRDIAAGKFGGYSLRLEFDTSDWADRTNKLKWWVFIFTRNDDESFSVEFSKDATHNDFVINFYFPWIDRKPVGSNGWPWHELHSDLFWECLNMLDWHIEGMKSREVNKLTEQVNKKLKHIEKMKYRDPAKDIPITW